MPYAIRLTLNGKRMQSGRTFKRKAAASSFVKNNIPTRFRPSVVMVNYPTLRRKKPVRRRVTKRVARKKKTTKKRRKR